jgi:acetyltransferase-like isoleucine patch superfamily enzyme
VFIGPGVVFTDDPHPPCPRYKECVLGATVEKDVRIGAHSTILPGVVIRENSLVGAGSVVTKNIPKNSVVIGSPAKVLKNIRELQCAKGFFKRPYEWESKP